MNELTRQARSVIIAIAMVGACASPEQVVEIHGRLGLAALLPEGSLCLAAAKASLEPGTILSAASIPQAGMPSDPKILELEIVRSADDLCSPIWGVRDEVNYLVRVAGDEPRVLGPLLVLLEDTWEFATPSGDVQISWPSSERKLSARSCTSGEGVHLTLWDGPPLSGERVWHRYFYLGYDTEPSCLPMDYEDP